MGNKRIEQRKAQRKCNVRTKPPSAQNVGRKQIQRAPRSKERTGGSSSHRRFLRDCAVSTIGTVAGGAVLKWLYDEPRVVRLQGNSSGRATVVGALQVAVADCIEMSDAVEAA